MQKKTIKKELDLIRLFRSFFHFLRKTIFESLIEINTDLNLGFIKNLKYTNQND